MVTYNQIRKLIEVEFEKFISKLINNGGSPRKYFYWSLDFFEDVAQLSFQHYYLSARQKENISIYGEHYFDSSEVQVSINKSSIRNEISLRHYHKLFDKTNKAGQEARFDYIKEYILLELLRSYKLDLDAEYVHYKFESSPDNTEKVKKKNEEFKYISEVVKKQEVNFLITYITYLLNYSKKPNLHALRNYIKYDLTNQGAALLKKLDEFDREYIFDSKTGKEIKQTKLNLNPNLRNKIEGLYILKNEESKIHFVFSCEGGEGKEELRELLDIMGGKDDANHLYRGQANSSWALDASITREPKYLHNESQLYYDILSLKPDAFKEDHSVYERLITMQHYGMPTRLLDVSRNPLVAIFFACNNMECANQDGTVFTFSPSKESFLNFENKKLRCLVKIVENEDKSEICNNCYTKSECPKGVVFSENSELPDFFSKNWFVKGVAKNQRINNQSGDFIFVGLNGSQKELTYFPQKTIIIDSDSKRVLLEQLETLNIHGGSVYPDITHMSNYIKKKFEKLDTPNNLQSNDIEKHNEDIQNIDSGEYKKQSSGSWFQKELLNPSKSASEEFKDIFQQIFRSEEQAPTEPVQLISTFEPNDFWNEKRIKKLEKFAKSENLNATALMRVLDDYYFSQKVPLRDEVLQTMNSVPALKERGIIIDELTRKIIKLSEDINYLHFKNK